MKNKKFPRIVEPRDRFDWIIFPFCTPIKKYINHVYKNIVKQIRQIRILAYITYNDLNFISLGSTGHHKEMAANNNVYKKTEEIRCLTSEFYGLIIGTGGSTVNNIRTLSGAEVIIDSKGSGKSFLKGNQEQRKIARRMIEDKIDECKIDEKRESSYGDDSHKNHDNGFGDEWLELNFVSKDVIGMVIGKNGETIKRFQNKFNVNLEVRDNKMFIRGDPKTDPNIAKAIEELDYFVWTKKNYARPDNRKFIYIAGNPKSILIVESPHVPSLSYLGNPPSLVDENETAQQEAADLLLEAFQITKKEQNKMARTGTGELPSPVASYLVHAGGMFSTLQPGTYPSQSESFQKSLDYQRLTPADLDIAKMESLPKVNE